MLGSIYEYEFEGKKYNFVITRKARLAIEEMQRSVFDDMGDTSAFTTMMSLNSLETQIKNAKVAGDEKALAELEKEKERVTEAMIPNMKDFAKMQNKAQDEYEIAKILLMNSEHANGVVSAELAEKILDKMEFELGDADFLDKTLEIYDKVFTQIATIRDRKETIDKRNSLQNEQALPMS